MQYLLTSSAILSISLVTLFLHFLQNLSFRVWSLSFGILGSVDLLIGNVRLVVVIFFQSSGSHSYELALKVLVSVFEDASQLSTGDSCEPFSVASSSTTLFLHFEQNLSFLVCFLLFGILKLDDPLRKNWDEIQVIFFLVFYDEVRLWGVLTWHFSKCARTHTCIPLSIDFAPHCGQNIMSFQLTSTFKILQKYISNFCYETNSISKDV